MSIRIQLDSPETVLRVAKDRKGAIVFALADAYGRIVPFTKADAVKLFGALRALNNEGILE